MPSARAGTSLVAKGRLVEPHRKCLTDVWSLALCNGAASGKGQAIGLKHCDPMSEMGQKAKYSLRADVFCFAPESGHCGTESACPFRAKTGSRNRLTDCTAVP